MRDQERGLKKENAMKVLIIFAAYDQLETAGLKTHCRLEEFGAPYEVLKGTNAVIK